MRRIAVNLPVLSPSGKGRKTLALFLLYYGSRFSSLDSYTLDRLTVDINTNHNHEVVGVFTFRVSF